MNDSPTKVERLKKRINELEAHNARLVKSAGGKKCHLIGVFSFLEGRHYLTSVMTAGEDALNISRSWTPGRVQTYVTLLSSDGEDDYSTAEAWIRKHYASFYPEFAKTMPLYVASTDEDGTDVVPIEKEGADE